MFCPCALLLLGFDGLQLSATGEKKEEDGVE
jgi:hypothetical protein